jgi:hypothetical protein
MRAASRTSTSLALKPERGAVESEHTEDLAGDECGEAVDGLGR